MIFRLAINDFYLHHVVVAGATVVAPLLRQVDKTLN